MKKWMLGAHWRLESRAWRGARQAARVGIYIGAPAATVPCPGPGYVWVPATGLMATGFRLLELHRRTRRPGHSRRRGDWPRPFAARTSRPGRYFSQVASPLLPAPRGLSQLEGPFFYTFRRFPHLIMWA